MSDITEHEEACDKYEKPKKGHDHDWLITIPESELAALREELAKVKEEALAQTTSLCADVVVCFSLLKPILDAAPSAPPHEFEKVVDIFLKKLEGFELSESSKRFIARVEALEAEHEFNTIVREDKRDYFPAYKFTGVGIELWQAVEATQVKP